MRTAAVRLKRKNAKVQPQPPTRQAAEIHHRTRGTRGRPDWSLWEIELADRNHSGPHRAPMERDGTGWNWMARPISNQVTEGAWSPATESPSAFSTEGVPPVRQHPQGNPRGPHDALFRASVHGRTHHRREARPKRRRPGPAADLTCRDAMAFTICGTEPTRATARSSAWSTRRTPTPQPASIARPTAWSPTRSIRCRKAREHRPLDDIISGPALRH